MEWHRLSPSEALERLGSSESGIGDAEARARLAQYGENRLPEAKAASMLSIALHQFASPIIYVLLASAGIVLALGDFVDAAIIMVVLVVNAAVGAVQEGRAQNTLSALQKMVRTNAIVVRSGREVVIPSEEAVKGDVIVLKEGDKVPADARIFEARALKADESALTGESEPVSKHAEALDADLPAPDRRNMVFRGTYVVGGEGRAVVVATGTETVIGSISQKLATIDTDVPLKASIASLSRAVIAIVGIVCALIFAIGLMRGIPFKEMFVTAVAVAVSATPEGLPVVVTIVLAAGMYRMSKQNALVRRLQAVEALGQAKVIALDKTGTITLNQMAVEAVYVGGASYAVSGNGYEPRGSIAKDGIAIEPLIHEDMLLAGKIAALTATASVAYSEANQEWERISGDPTEAALLVFSQKVGFDKDALEQEHERIMDFPFSSDTKYHASLNEMQGKLAFSAAGAPESILAKSTRAWKGGKAVPMTDAERADIDKAMASMSRLGLRMVAFGIAINASKEIEPGVLPELCFVGIAGIADSIRSDVADALARAKDAGVRIVMITGDHPETAKAIAEKVGIWKQGDGIVTGKELATMSDAELAHMLPTATVFARVAPEDKLKIIEAYRKHGEIIAMTGDGVNDALSLAAADLGVAMGKIGTEVAKEAADMVLLDDNFGNIVAAIEEGRNVYKSIKKVVLYLFSTSVGEILAISVAMIAGWPIPLLASQIIWMNFVTDGFLVVALALEPKSPGLLASRKAKGSIVDRLMAIRISIIAVAMTVPALALFFLYLPEGFAKASTIALATLSACQWLNTLNCRAESHSIFRKGRFGNPYLIVALAAVIGLQLLAFYTAPLQAILHTVPLTWSDWGVVLGASLLVVIVEEIRKLIYRIAKAKRS